MDGKENTKQDALQGTGRPSVGKTSPSLEPKAYTEKEVDKLIRERHSTLDKRIADLNKQLKLKEGEAGEVQGLKAKVAELEEEQERKELAEAEDNPDLKRQIQDRKISRQRQSDLDKRERELKARELEHEEAIKAVTQYNLGKLAGEIVSKYPGIEAADLIELSDGSPEKMEKIAQRLSKKEAPGLRPDSGISVGSGEPTIEQLDKMTPEEYAEWRKRKKGGKR